MINNERKIVEEGVNNIDYTISNGNGEATLINNRGERKKINNVVSVEINGENKINIDSGIAGQIREASYMFIKLDKEAKCEICERERDGEIIRIIKCKTG